MFLLDDLLVGLPVKGILSVFEKVYDMAQTELTDESKIKEELLQLQLLYESDQITEEEYQKKEAALLERLTLAAEAQGDPA